MPSTFDFCFPTGASSVPDHPVWLHEVKYDGYRLRLEREGNRVRLITRGGYNWSDRYPWIVAAARRNRHRQFVIDGEAVLLGVDGISDFDALFSRRHDELVQLYAFDILVPDGEALRGLPLSVRKVKLARLLARHPDGIFVADFEQGEIRPRPLRSRLRHGARRYGVEAGGSPVSARTIERLDQDQEPQASGLSAGAGLVLGRIGGIIGHAGPQKRLKQSGRKRMRTAFMLALAAIVPIPFEIDQSRAADRVPAFDISQNCKTEAVGSGVGSVPSCVKDETDAKGQLVKSWSAFGDSAEKRSCVEESTIGGDQSYVELLTCLEMSTGDFGH